MEKKKYLFRELVVDSRTGLNPRKNFKLGHGDNYYITIKDIHDGEVVITDKTERIDDNAMKIINKRSRLKVGDVLFSSIGRIGETAIIKEEPKNWNINESVFAFTMNKNLITPEFFRWMFKAPKYKNEIQRESTGSTFVSIKMNKLNEMEFEIPTKLNEQINIVNDLENITSMISNCNKRIACLDELINSKFKSMFGTPLINEMHFDVSTVNDVCDAVTDGSHFSPKGVQTGFPMLSVKDMTDSGFDYSECKFVSKNDFEILEKQGCVPEVGDVLIAKDGSYFAKGFVVSNYKKEAVLSSIAILKPNLNIINPYYLKHYLLSKQIKDLVETNFITGTALKRVILRGIKDIPVQVPKIYSQNDFEKYYLEVNSMKKILTEEINNLNELLNSKIDCYFGI